MSWLYLAVKWDAKNIVFKGDYAQPKRLRTEEDIKEVSVLSAIDLK